MSRAEGGDIDHLTIFLEEAEDGWIAARIAEYPGAISQGRSDDEARAHVIEALDDLLDRGDPNRPASPEAGPHRVL